MEHRDVCECQPLKIGPSASIQDSLVYNGCIVEGRVERSILFPGVHVKKGAVVKDSVLFFNNKVGHGSRLEKVVSDVNVSIGKACMIGDPGPVEIKEVTVLGWNNFIPDNTQIGSDCTVYPALPPEKFSRKIKTGEMVR
jgi:glucose-1-phosphate adenylyltransferase